MDWGAIANAASGFLGGIGQGFMSLFGQKSANQTNIDLQREANEANMRLAQYQWSKNLDMWQMQNAYNSPAAQMSRFKAAGLNPNLIYDKGNGGNATSLPSYSSPRMQATTVNPAIFKLNGALDVLGRYMDYRIKSAQEQQIREQTNNIVKQRNDLWNAMITNYVASAGYSDARAQNIYNMFPYQRDLMDAQTNLALSNILLNNKRIDNYEFDWAMRSKDYALRSKKFNWLKYIQNKRYLLDKESARITNSINYQTLNRLGWENNFMREYGVMPNTYFGQRIGAFVNAYENPDKSYSKYIGNYIDAELAKMIGSSIPQFGLFGSQGSAKRRYNRKYGKFFHFKF